MTTEEKNKIRSLELRTLLDSPIDRIRIPIRNKSFLDKIMFKPDYRDFVIYKTRMCNMARLAEIAYRFPELNGDVNNHFDLIKITVPLIKDHRKDILYLIAACIQNTSKEPKSSLIKFLDDNLHGDSLNELGTSCILNSGLMSFFSFALTLKGVSAAIAEGADVDPAETQE